MSLDEFKVSYYLGSKLNQNFLLHINRHTHTHTPINIHILTKFQKLYVKNFTGDYI